MPPATLVRRSAPSAPAWPCAPPSTAERTERVLTIAKPGEIVVGPGVKGAPGVGPVRRVRLGGEEIGVARAK